MSVKRGDVILTYVPNIGSFGGKVRPALVVQSDHNNARLSETAAFSAPQIRGTERGAEQ